MPGLRGAWFVRRHAARDLAAPRGDQPLLWDAWGLMEGEPSGDDLEVLDRACQLAEAGDEAAPELARLYRASPRLVMGDRVTRYGPNHPAGTPVTLDVSP